MSQNSYEIKGNIIAVGVSTGISKGNIQQFNDNFDLIFRKGKEGDPCLASKQNTPTTQANQGQELGQVKSDNAQWPAK